LFTRGYLLIGVFGSGRWIIEEDALRGRKLIIKLPVAYTPDKSGQEYGGYRDTGDQQDDYGTHKTVDLLPYKSISAWKDV
jgi:hypothetical protein